MKTEDKKIEKPNRFTYSDDEGLSIVSKSSDKTEPKKKETEDKPIKKGYEQWL